MNDSTLFRTPPLPNRPTRTTHFDSYRLNLNVSLFLFLLFLIENKDYFSNLFFSQKASRSKQNRWSKSRINRTPKQVVVQRLLPLQPGIAQPYVLTTSEVNYPNASIDNNTLLKSTKSSIVECNSTLTTENLNKLNTYSETINSNTVAVNNNMNNELNNIDMSRLLDSDTDDCDNEIQNCDVNQDKLQFLEIPETDIIISDDDIEEEENQRLHVRLDDDPGIRSLMELSLPSPLPLASSSDECNLKAKAKIFKI